MHRDKIHKYKFEGVRAERGLKLSCKGRIGKVANEIHLAPRVLK